jgi:hypothetical protein
MPNHQRPLNSQPIHSDRRCTKLELEFSPKCFFLSNIAPRVPTKNLNISNKNQLNQFKHIYGPLSKFTGIISKINVMV